ncbi:lipase family protein [Nocardioides sambongensis]|uniref:lipase family protein n=1 Tax=Nocardioides sambongensis TaxID=2589074 RepID=UPI001126E5AF|nr:lipase family protein [Nocardioides sambongensis]
MKKHPARIIAALSGLALATTVATTATSAPAQAGPARPAAAPITVAAAPLDDPFFDYDGTTPLEDVAPGTVLKTRTIPYTIQGLSLPLKAHQILYRTRNTVGDAVTNVTTVVRPALSLRRDARVVSYQSFYDSLNPADQPSAAIAGGQGLGPAIANIETLLIKPLLLAGYTINIPDTEGQTANFAAGPEYGYTTLDSLKALPDAPVTRVDDGDPIGLIGYSGGAIASEWAAELAPTYAPEVADDLVGTAIGGVLVHPGKNLRYVEGSSIWAGVAPMALVGIGRAFGVDFDPYLNDRGREVFAELQDASITEVLGAYAGLTWADLVKPAYTDPYSVTEFVDVANQLIMGTGGTPTAPMFIGQGNGGELEGTPAGGPDIGEGDGVMIAGDVRALARQYCDAGVRVKYAEYELSHFTSIATWLPQAYAWLLARFGPFRAPDNCGSIKPGNSLAPLVHAQR